MKSETAKIETRKFSKKSLNRFPVLRIKRSGKYIWTWYDRPDELDGTEQFWCFSTRNAARTAAAISRLGKLERRRKTRLQYCAEIRAARISLLKSICVVGSVVEVEIPEWSSNTPALHCQGNVLSHVWTGNMGFTGDARNGNRVLRRRLVSDSDARAFADRIRKENSGKINVTFAGCW
jgi:hypothetical protein